MRSGILKGGPEFSMKKLSRRAFLKSVGLGAAGLTALDVIGGGKSAEAATLLLKSRTDMPEFKLQYAEETHSICGWCSGGCGVIIYTKDGKVIDSIGDPDHPINEGGMCPKGRALSDLRHVVGQSERRHSMWPNPRIDNPRRLTKPLYRAPHSTEWQEISWDDAITEIVKRVKATRDATFETTDANGVTVNRTQAIAQIGSATINNEENYLMQKWARALGLVNICHHARL